MKIFFICGSLEPGRDGVGDYSRRLCVALLRKGIAVQILSLCDQHAISFIREYQTLEESTVVVNRIPKATTNKQRFIWSQGIITDFEPDWISVQYVPYSFHPKGMPLWLPSFFKKIKGNHQWHIMFHELWIGMDTHDSFKNKCIGFFQKYLLLKILDGEEKKILNTQIDLYQYQLESLGYNVQILPLFSNIIKNRESNFEKNKDDLELRFCLFGSIHYGAPVQQFIRDLQLVLSSSKEQRVLKFIFIGSCGIAIEEWKEILIANKINFESTGFVSDQEISTILSSCHYGISTTPYVLNQKSGSLAAMLDHELPVLCVARDWDVEGFDQSMVLNLINYENKATVADFINRKFIVSDQNKLEFVAQTFLKGLK